jgi:hypothetical protein
MTPIEEVIEFLMHEYYRHNIEITGHTTRTVDVAVPNNDVPLTEMAMAVSHMYNGTITTKEVKDGNSPSNRILLLQIEIDPTHQPISTTNYMNVWLLAIAVFAILVNLVSLDQLVLLVPKNLTNLFK